MFPIGRLMAITASIILLLIRQRRIPYFIHNRRASIVRCADFITEINLFVNFDSRRMERKNKNTVTDNCTFDNKRIEENSMKFLHVFQLRSMVVSHDLIRSLKFARNSFDWPNSVPKQVSVNRMD